MNIAFIANHYKTIFFQGVAKRLESKGFNVYWIAPGRLWSEWLSAEGVPPSRLLDFSAFGSQWTNGIPLSCDEAQEIAKQEAIGGWNANNIILMDRLLRRRPHDYALKYMSVILQEVPKFLVGNQIECVLSEHTWTLEILTAHLCEQLGVMNVEPADNRVPSESFCFFSGNAQSHLSYVREVTYEDRERAAKFYDEYLLRKPRPGYCNSSRLPRPELNWLPKMLANVMRERRDPYDETRRPLRQIVRYRGKEALRARMALRCKHFSFPDPEPMRPYVLFPLHVQPERSIDVFGAFFSNQLELIKTLSRTIPATHDLYVKEHFCGLGNRSAHDYNELRKIPGVRLIHPYADTFSVVSKADLVIGISSTVAYEAALLGKPAISIAPMYFGELLSDNGFNPYVDSLSRVLDSAQREYSACGNSEEKRAKSIEFLAYVMAQSFPGTISDPRSDAGCIEQANLDIVTDGFVQFLTHKKAACAGKDQHIQVGQNMSENA